MEFTVALVTLVAVAVLVKDTAASDVSQGPEKRDKRNFGFEFGSEAPDSIRDFISGRNFVSSRDFFTGMGYSSSLKYGPGLGLSSRLNSSASPSSEDLEPSPSSPAPSSEVLVPSPSSPLPLPLSVSTVQAPYAVHDVPTQYAVSAHRSVPYVAGQPVSVPVADPVVVVAISYGPSDPGYVPSAISYGPATTGYVPTVTDYSSLYGEWPFAPGTRFRRTVARFPQHEIAEVE